MRNLNNNIKRNYYLDILRLICCFLVVCIHFPSTNNLTYLSSLTRIAVPIFYMIGGFYYNKKVNSQENKIKLIIKIIKMSLSFSGLMLIYNIIKRGFSYFISLFNIFGYLDLKTISDFIIFNIPPLTKSHLWYMYALIYVYFIFLFTNEKQKAFIVKAIPLLLFCNLFLGTYSSLVFNNIIDLKYSRNFLFTSLPFFTLGYYISKNDFLNNVKSIKKSLFALIFSILFTFLEMKIIELNNITGNVTIYASTIVNAFIIFIICLWLNKNTNTNFSNVSNLSKKYSTSIYAIHIIIGKIVDDLLINSYLYMTIRPLIVFTVSLLFSILLQSSKEKINKLINKIRITILQ